MTKSLIWSLRSAATDVAIGCRITDTGFGVDGMLFEEAADEIEYLRLALAPIVETFYAINGERGPEESPNLSKVRLLMEKARDALARTSESEEPAND
jgi:hypothetical protein